MKKAIIFLVLIAVSACLASAQNCNVDYLGTKTLYKKPAQKLTPAPAGYKPVFINHVGRHGARHLTKDVNTAFAYTLLLQADSANGLTQQGKKLMAMVLALQKVEKGNTKSISAEGINELNGLGGRMYANYANVFKGKLNLNVAVTKEIRTKQSADAFLHGLNTTRTDSASVNFYNDDTNLRFYDLSPAYKTFEDNVDDGELTRSLEKAEHADEMNKAITSRVFTAGFLTGLDKKGQAKFVSDIFGFATIVYSLNKEIKQAGFTPAQVDIKSLFTCTELQKLALLDDADEYLKKGPATNNDGIQVRVAVPLLVNFINTTDDYIKQGTYNAQLRFAHAETIAPFAALLQLSPACKPTNKLLNINSIWQASNVIPLSSNIQWIFYRKQGKPGYLVKILFNEKEAHITGLSTSRFPYYNWADLRAFYLAKLNRLNVKLSDDMGNYLTGLQ